MKYRSLGRTGLNVSEIGIGTWAFGGPTTFGGIQIGWGKVEDKVSLETLARCFDLGINFIDTADSYGKGHSEEIVGMAVKGRRDRVIIATKCGNFEDEQGRWVQSWRPDDVKKACENSLQRLQTDYIDLYQIHTPLPDKGEFRYEPETFEVFEDLKRRGKILHYGYSSNTTEDTLRVMETGYCDTIQVVYNILNRSAERELFGLAMEREIGIIVRVPLASGFLSGKFNRDVRFDGNDHRVRLSRASIAEMVEKVEKVRPFAEKTGRTLSQFALQFCLSHDAVSVVIPGAKTPQQLEQNAKASDLGKLLPQELRELDHLLHR